MSNSKNLLWMSAVLSVLSGCSTVNVMMGKGEKISSPKILILNFSCDDPTIGEGITQGLLKNLSSKVDVFDGQRFQLLIASMTRLRESEGREPRGPVINFSSSAFYPDLAKSQYFRTQVNLETGLDYCVTGEAKEQKLPEGEPDNLKTAETARMEFLELRTGQKVQDNFKQGLFEIVAPDRIGSKFAAKINKYFSGVRKLEKQEAKDLQKKFSEE